MALEALRLERYILPETSDPMAQCGGISEPWPGPGVEGGHALARSGCY